MRFCTGVAEVWATSPSKTARRICRAASGGISWAGSGSGTGGTEPGLAASGAQVAGPEFPSVLCAYTRAGGPGQVGAGATPRSEHGACKAG